MRHGGSIMTKEFNAGQYPSLCLELIVEEKVIINYKMKGTVK